ncbi:MAG TPA: Wzz/FepE/Etk N-terminal domain-containing protein [Rubrobacteraceae bacterium]|nr:Wzz/FepE/Etk N-terminal domain-containing protein [Rubrobacteraceae bacterium]
MRSINRRSWRSEDRNDPSLSEVLYVLWERRPLIVGAVALLVLAAVAFGFMREPVYTAEAIVNVRPQQSLESDEEKTAFLEQVRGVVATDADFNREVMRRAGWETGAADFTERLDPEPYVAGDEAGLRVRFSGSEPGVAARAANAYAEHFVERVEQLNDERIAGGSLAAEASMVQRATPPERSNPRPLLYAVLAAGAGVLIGGAAALLLEGRARGWRDVRDVELTLRAPVLGVIPDYSSDGKEA